MHQIKFDISYKRILFRSDSWDVFDHDLFYAVFCDIDLLWIGVCDQMGAYLT